MSPPPSPMSPPPSPLLGAHPHVSAINSGSWAHSKLGINPTFPDVSSIPQDAAGCPGKVNIASGLVTLIPSPHTLHVSLSISPSPPPSPPPLPPSPMSPPPSPLLGAHPHVSAINSGSWEHSKLGINPTFPDVS